MLGWEFPPYFAGGVGMVCYEMAKEISNNFKDIEVEYVMPYGPDEKFFSNNFKISSANISFDKIKNLNVSLIPTTLYSYDTSESYLSRFSKFLEFSRKNLFSDEKSIKQLYGKDLIEEVYLYGLRIFEKFKNNKFDIIHAHDWTTIPAALMLKEATNKPLILHVHITEFDKTGGHPGSEDVMKIEREGFEKADLLITVSNFTKNRLINNYGIDPKKIQVVHNGGISDLIPTLDKEIQFSRNHKIVLYAGRITLQKGVEYFIQSAKRVLEFEPNTRFIVAGTGDMLAKMIELTANLGIGKNVLFHGFYNREEANMFYTMADVFVMPSVSEPFGIVPFEAAAKGTPCIISKQSGISEVFENCFKIDFWDIEEMTDNIVSLLKYPHLSNEMRTHAFHEFKNNFSWNKPIKKIKNIYTTLI